MARFGRSVRFHLPPQGRRESRRFRLRRGQAIALVLLLIVTGSLQQSLDHYARGLIDRRAAAASVEPPPVNTAPDETSRAQIAPPPASGAFAPYPLNHTLDAETVYPGGEVANHDFEDPAQTAGTPPSNHDLSAAPTSQGTQLTNFDFASGTFTGWTAGSGVTIQTSGGPDGAWAQLTSTGTLTSDAFTPETDAQAIVFDYGAFNTASSNTAYLYAKSGASYSTNTLLATLSCANCSQWSTVQVGIGQWIGQSIKLQVQRSSGTIGIDRVAKQILFSGFTTSGNISRPVDSGDAFASIADLLTSAPLTVEPTAQHVTLSLRGLTTGSDTAYVKVLSGAGYTTVTTLTPSFTDSWTTARLNLASFSGQSIKLQVDVITGRVGVDDIGIMRIDAPGWTLGSGTTVPSPSPVSSPAVRSRCRTMSST